MTMTDDKLFGLPHAAVEKIRGVFASYPQIEKALLYGSRAKGDYKNGSDIDLTLIGEGLDLSVLLKVLNQLDDLLLPWMFDVSIFEQIDHSGLREHIERVGKVFYERDIMATLDREQIFSNLQEHNKGFVHAAANRELEPLIKVLSALQAENRISLAVLYGSFANGSQHKRSDIDLAIAIPLRHQSSELEIIDHILMSTERQISILRLDDLDESPLVVQEALKGVHLVKPDVDMLYAVADWALHESESIRGRRQKHAGH